MDGLFRVPSGCHLLLDNPILHRDRSRVRAIRVVVRRPVRPAHGSPWLYVVEVVEVVEVVDVVDVVDVGNPYTTSNPSPISPKCSLAHSSACASSTCRCAIGFPDSRGPRDRPRRCDFSRHSTRNAARWSGPNPRTTNRSWHGANPRVALAPPTSSPLCWRSLRVRLLVEPA